MNNNPIFTTGGVWIPVASDNVTSTNTGAVVSHSALIRINASGQYGVVVDGWGWQGNFGGAGTTEKIAMALLSPDSSGKLSVNTSSYISDPLTNGANSILVADFNGDGRSDIFLAAHNESPFLAMPSTAYMSNASGGYTKVTLTDSVMAHDAELAYINSKPVVITTTYNPGDINPIYSYVNGSFIVSEPTYDETANGMSSIVGSYGKSGALELVRGDVMSGYDSASHFFNSSTINVYAFNGLNVTSISPLQVITPYLSTLPELQSYVSHWGKNITHTYRVWDDDLNHDGRPDILAGESMWSTTNSNYPSCLQVLINNGDGTFKDMTNSLNPSIGFDHDEFDYNPTFVDIDHSGINTLLFSSFGWDSITRQSNYVLLNDGTGHLYAGMHEQFAQLTPQVIAYLQQTYTTDYFIDPRFGPKFIAVPQQDGSINFVAEVPVSVKNGFTQLWQTEYAFVNIPLGYNPTYDFTENITVADRNSSMLVRTWAGSDTIYDTNASVNSHIDGGLGVDKCNYSDKLSSYSLKALGGASFEVKNLVSSQAPAVDDTVVNVERLHFSDVNIALDTSGASGQAYRLYKAAFDRTPDQAGLGYWINAFDHGSDLMGVASSFIASPEFTAMYGANSTDINFVTLLYNHVLDRNPDQGGYDFWLGAMAKGLSREDVLVNFSESKENIANVADLIANGIQYQEWVG